MSKFQFKFDNAAPADFVADSISAVLTTAIKYFVVDRGIEYARAKVDDLLAPPEVDDVVEGEVVQEEKEIKKNTPKATKKGNSSK